MQGKSFEHCASASRRDVYAAQGRHSREINLGQLMREEYGQRVRRSMLGPPRAFAVPMMSQCMGCDEADSFLLFASFFFLI